MTAPLTSQAIRACPALRKIILQQAANAAASLSFPALKSEACRFEGQTPRGRALQKEYRRAYLASAKGKAAMKRYRQSAKGQAASRTARKKYSNRPKEGLPSRRYGSATRNTRRLIENPPGPGTACDPAWENKACRANKTVWFLLPS